MDNLLIFFALPVATIILAVVLQRILRCPILVAATAFAIYLIVTFAVFDASFLIFAILYTILAFIAAYIACLVSRYRLFNCNNSCGCGNNSTLTASDGNLNNTFCSNNSVLGTGNDYNFYDNSGLNSNFSSISSNNNPNFETLNYTGTYNTNNKNCAGTLYRCRK